MTVPHALITVVNHSDGRVFHPEIGSTVNVRDASFTVEGSTLNVHLPNGTYTWSFECATSEIARKFMTTFAIRAQR